MRTYSQATVQRLYGRSGNQCAFPGCDYQIITDGGQVQGRICHIKGLRPGSARYDSTQTDKQRNAYENLVLMCANHHDAIDAQEENYTVEVLHEMKALAEATFGRDEHPSDAIMARILMNGVGKPSVTAIGSNVAIHSPGVIQGKVIKITNQKGPPKIQPPPGSIGADGDASRMSVRSFGFTMNMRRTNRVGSGRSALALSAGISRTSSGHVGNCSKCRSSLQFAANYR